VVLPCFTIKNGQFTINYGEFTIKNGGFTTIKHGFTMKNWWLYHQYQEADEVGITPILG